MTTEPRLAVFFVRCPDPLGFASTSSQYVELAGDLEGYKDVALHLNADGTAQVWHGSPSRHFVSVRFHTGKRTNSVINSFIREVHSVVSAAVPESVCEPLDQSQSEPARDDKWSTFTMAELVTPLVARDSQGVFRPVEPAPGAMFTAFELCVDVLFLIIRACRNALKLQLDTPTRERLGPDFFAVARKSGDGLEAWDLPGSWVVNSLSIPNGQAPLVDDNQVQVLTSGILMEILNHPLISSAELQSEASAARRHGDYRAAIMLYHTASEVQWTWLLCSCSGRRD